MSELIIKVEGHSTINALAEVEEILSPYKNISILGGRADGWFQKEGQ